MVAKCQAGRYFNKEEMSAGIRIDVEDCAKQQRLVARDRWFLSLDSSGGPFLPSHCFSFFFSSFPLTTSFYDYQHDPARPTNGAASRHERRQCNQPPSAIFLFGRPRSWLWDRLQHLSCPDAAHGCAQYVLACLQRRYACRSDNRSFVLLDQIVPDMQHQPYHNLNTLGLQQHQYQSAGVFSTSPPHGSLPLANSPPPPSPEMYDPLSPPLSGSDTSGDGLYHHSNSSGANSPSSSRGHSLVHRRDNRYNPTPSPTSSSGRRRSRSQDSDDDDMGISYVENLANTRKEATRRQRIEAEQRRRDELREGYAKLKDALPVSNQKSSKVSLLERGRNCLSMLYNHRS